MQTIEIVHELLELADILEIAGANGHRVRAFRNGARSLESWQGDLAGLVEAGEVTSIRGIGSSLAAIIEEAVTGDRPPRPRRSEPPSRRSSSSGFAFPGSGRRRFGRSGRGWGSPASPSSRRPSARSRYGVSRASARKARRTSSPGSSG